MRPKALFVDIDGTLVGIRQEITPRTRDRLLQYQRDGGVVVLCSARPWAGMEQYGRELQLERYGGYYAAFNGGQLVSAATLQSVEACAFPPQQAAQVVRAAAETERAAQTALLPGWQAACRSGLDLAAARTVADGVAASSLNIMTYRGGTLVARRLEPYAVAEMMANRLKLEICPDFAAALGFGPVKFLVSGEPGFLSRVFPELKRRLPDCEAVISDPFFAEITPKGVDKGRALTAVARLLGVDPADCAAVGDSANDLPMFARAGASAAMANAPEEVRRAAGCGTAGCDEDGVAQFLDRLEAGG